MALGFDRRNCYHKEVGEEKGRLYKKYMENQLPIFYQVGWVVETGGSGTEGL